MNATFLNWIYFQILFNIKYTGEKWYIRIERIKKNQGLLQNLTSIVPVNGFVHGQFIHIHI